MEDSKSFQELQSLVELAEKTSDKAIDYEKEAKSRSTKQVFVGLFLLFFFAILAYLSLDFRTSNEALIIVSFIFGFCTIISAIFAFFQHRMIKELKRKSYIEKQVLKELLSMIDDVRWIVYKDNLASSIDKAVIEMRLKRISFSAELV